MALAGESSNIKDSEFAPWETVRAKREWTDYPWRREPGPYVATQRSCSSSDEQPERANLRAERPASSECTGVRERSSSTLFDTFLDWLDPSDSHRSSRAHLSGILSARCSRAETQ